MVVLVKVPLIEPEPLAPIPVKETVLSLVQLYTVPLTPPVNAIVVRDEPEQIVWDDGVATAFGIGLTTTVAVTAAPVQPFAVGIIVNVTVIGAAVVFVNAPLISPAPLAAMPVTETVLSLVQLNTVPVTPPVNTMVVMDEPEQIVWDNGAAITVGVELTTTVAIPAKLPVIAVQLASAREVTE